MKALSYLFLLPILVFAMSSCGDSATEDGTTTEDGAPAANWTMTAVVDSLPWKAEKVNTREEQGTIYITGTSEDGSQVILELGERPTIGIFSIRRGTLQAATYVNKEGSKYYTPFGGTTGVINITQFAKDSLLAGEFNFSASNTLDLHIVSQGMFTAPIIKSAAAPAL